MRALADQKSALQPLSFNLPLTYKKSSLIARLSLNMIIYLCKHNIRKLHEGNHTYFWTSWRDCCIECL